MRSYQRILLIICIVLGWDSASFLMTKYLEVIAISNTNVANLKNEIIEKEVSYKQSVMRMVENIYRTDSFLSMGGSTEILEYDIDSFFAAMDRNTYALNIFLEDAENFFNNREEYFSEIPDIWPVEDHPLNKISSEFGPRFDPFTLKFIGQHKGIDIKSYAGAPILATADGVVKDHWIYDKEFGRSVRIEHKNGYMTFYGHMSKVEVHEGDIVKKGDVIGYMGMTGKATGYHIHYEIVKDGIKLNPIDYLRKKIGV